MAHTGQQQTKVNVADNSHHTSYISLSLLQLNNHDIRLVSENMCHRISADKIDFMYAQVEWDNRGVESYWSRHISPRVTYTVVSRNQGWLKEGIFHFCYEEKSKKKWLR